VFFRLIATEIKRAKDLGQSLGARVAEPLMPQFHHRRHGSEGLRLRQGVQVVGAVTAESLLPGVEILKSNSKRLAMLA
jgi:hypothetical protein